ncbi:MAG: cyclase family protein, partial [Alphaproteobacteria bacterium]|nr:cyclase family protein [Alphaproteobacteria bacterium]
MLSRRSILTRSAAAGVAAVAAGMVTARASLANGSGKAVDLTYGYDGNFPTYEGKPGITSEKV